MERPDNERGLADRPLKIMKDTEPMLLVLYCPECKFQHIDADEWLTRPHKTHLCLQCGHEWAPANFPTVGVEWVSDDFMGSWAKPTSFTVEEQQTMLQALFDVVEPRGYVRRVRPNASLDEMERADESVSLPKNIAAEALIKVGVRLSNGEGVKISAVVEGLPYNEAAWLLVAEQADNIGKVLPDAMFRDTAKDIREHIEYVRKINAEVAE